LEDLREIAKELVDVAIVEQAPALEGKVMSMVLSSAKTAPKKPAEASPKPDASHTSPPAKPTAG
jgi:translation initiation factor IF-3